MQPEEQDRNNIIPKVRIDSQSKYLEKRKDEKVEEPEGDIREDEYLFGEEQPTEMERNKKILYLAKEHEKAPELEVIQGHHMPVEKQDKDIPPKYIEIDEREKQPHSEQKVWEDVQRTQSQWNFGAKNAEKIMKEKGKVDYLIFFFHNT